MVQQTNKCWVRLCDKPVYDGSFGPPGFAIGDTNMCKEHYFEWITVHDVIYDTTGNSRRSLTEIGEIDMVIIREQARAKNPVDSVQEIPWARPQSDNQPWRD